MKEDTLHQFLEKKRNRINSQKIKHKKQYWQGFTTTWSRMYGIQKRYGGSLRLRRENEIEEFTDFKTINKKT